MDVKELKILLEAVFILTRMNDLNSILEIIGKRAKVLTDEVSMSWLNAQIKNISLFGKTKTNKSIQVNLRNYADSSEATSAAFYVNTVEIIAKFSEIEYTTKSFFYETRDRETTGTTKYFCNSIFSSPFSVTSSDLIQECNEKSLLRKITSKNNKTAKEVIIQFIKDYVDKNIKGIEMVDEFKRFLVDYNSIDTEEKNRENMDLSQYGEGLQRVFYISLLFAYAENGIVCIDEFENAIYFGLLKEFTKLVQELAIEFNVQVFLTTHSKECVDAFIFNNYKTEDISAYRLFQKEDKIQSIRYSGEELKGMLETFDLDLRGTVK